MLRVEDIVPVHYVIQVKTDHRQPVVMQENSLPFLLEIFDSPHIHRIPIVAEIKCLRLYIRRIEGT